MAEQEDTVKDESQRDTQQQKRPTRAAVMRSKQRLEQKRKLTRSGALQPAFFVAPREWTNGYTGSPAHANYVAEIDDSGWEGDNLASPPSKPM